MEELICDTDVIIESTFLLEMINILYCQAQVRSPIVQSPKVKTKRTWADNIKRLSVILILNFSVAMQGKFNPVVWMHLIKKGKSTQD